MSTPEPCRCAAGALHPPLDVKSSPLEVDEAVEAPCRCRPPAVVPSGRPSVDEHRHWSVVEWGLAGPTIN